MGDTASIVMVAPAPACERLLADADPQLRDACLRFTDLAPARAHIHNHGAQVLLCDVNLLRAAGEPGEWRGLAGRLPLVLILEQPPTLAESKALLLVADDYIALEAESHGAAIAHAIDNAVNMHKLHNQFQQVLAESPDGVVIVDARGAILYANSAAAVMLGRKATAMVGEDFTLPTEHKAASEVELPNSGVAEMRVVDIEWRGHPALLASLRDITQRKQVEKKLTHAAERDALTGLSNRTHFQSELSAAIAWAADREKRVAVFFIDMDDFKAVNDNHGHDAGDQLLRTVADRLRAASRTATLLARLGGDEFVAMARDVDVGGESQMAERFLKALGRPARINDVELDMSASIGVATFPHAGRNAHALVTAADAAMYAAKEAGRNQYRLYSREAGSATARRKRLDSDMRHALSRDQMTLVY